MMIREQGTETDADRVVYLQADLRLALATNAMLQEARVRDQEEIKRLRVVVGSWQRQFGDAQAMLAHLQQALARCVKAQGQPL